MNTRQPIGAASIAHAVHAQIRILAGTSKSGPLGQARIARLFSEVSPEAMCAELQVLLDAGLGHAESEIAKRLLDSRAKLTAKENMGGP